MAVPVASRIRRTFPNALIAWAVDTRISAVLDTERLVDLRYEVPRENWKSRHVSWWLQLRHFARLRPFKFDYGLDLQGHSKTAICLRIANPKRRVASRATDIVARVVNPVLPTFGAKHWVARNLEVLASLGEFGGDPSPIMPDVSRFEARLLQDISSFRNLVTISIGAGHPTKKYEPARWLEVADMLSHRGYSVALLGGQGEDIPAPGIVNWIDKLSLAETMAAVSRSTLHLASDTGTGHIAAAYNVPVISVFGYTDPEQYRPYTENAIVLDAGRQMKGVSPAEILAAAESLLQRQVHALSH